MDQTNEYYEYIIVGSGPGGGPLAANLARRGHKVLLLEAGDDQGDNLNEMIPAFFAAASEDPLMRWDFFVKHYANEKQAAKDPKMTWETPDGGIFVGLDPPPGSKQKGIWYPRAGTLGGCAVHNALVTVLPHDDDWERIVEITGDHTWNAGQMRRYFERLERCEYLPEGTPGHGFHGWLETNHPDPIVLEDNSDFVNAAVDAIRDSHGPRNPRVPFRDLIHDINSLNPQQKDGVYEITYQMGRTGRRSSPRNFLVATANARNPDGSRKYPLYIRTGSLVTRILFDHTSFRPKAIGVEFFEGKSLYKADPRALPYNRGVRRHVFASKEVIVSGGAFNSPQLLKLSGIGPKAELEAHRIPLVVDLPGVGTNLQDNYESSVIVRGSKNFSLFEKCTFALAGDPCLPPWIQGRGGPYASVGIAAGVLTKSSVSDGEEDLFLLGGPFNFSGYFPGYSQALSAESNAFAWDVLKVHPRNNSGTVTLRSSNPRDVPEINFNYFEPSKNGGGHHHHRRHHRPHDHDEEDFNDPEHDLTAMADGVHLAREIYDGIRKPIAPLTELEPGESANTANEIKQAIKNNSFSHHAGCTVPMGSDDDPMACLDSKLRVRGVRGLRVCDASVFPRLPGSFPTLPIYMVSEKATDMILEERYGSDDVLAKEGELLEILEKKKVSFDEGGDEAEVIGLGKDAGLGIRIENGANEPDGSVGVLNGGKRKRDFSANVQGYMKRIHS